MASLFRRRRSPKVISTSSKLSTPKPASPVAVPPPDDASSVSSASVGEASRSSESTESPSASSNAGSQDTFQLAINRPLPPSRLVSYATSVGGEVGAVDVYPKDVFPEEQFSKTPEDSSLGEQVSAQDDHGALHIPGTAEQPISSTTPASAQTPISIPATPAITIPSSHTSVSDDTDSVSSSPKSRRKGFWRRKSNSSKAGSPSTSRSSPPSTAGFKSSQLSPIPSSSVWSTPAYDPRDYSPSLAEKDGYDFGQGTGAHPPSYYSADDATTYEFTQISPFAMALALPGPAEAARPTYHISVGLNVWMPSSTVTYLRRGGESGPLVAQLDMGITAGSANITFAEECKPLGNVMFRKSSGSSSRYYFTGDGTIIRWKLGDDIWEAFCQSAPLATFTPGLPRTLSVRDYAHPLLDHLVLALLVLMREHLTPLAALSGDAAGLFNYGAGGTSRREALANQDW